MTLKSYKYRIYPTAEQRQQLAIDFGHARWLWNWALDSRNKAYQRRKESVSGIDISRRLTKLKKLSRYAWLKDANSTVLTQKLRDLDTAFNNFFKQRAKYPRFKKKHAAQSVRYQLDQRHIKKNFSAGRLLRIPKIGVIATRWSRVPGSSPKMVTVFKDAAGRYFVSFSVEEDIIPLPQRTNAAGLDVGLKDVIVTSDGWKSGNPRHLKQLAYKLKLEQRKLSRKTRGSQRYQKQRQRVAKVHNKIADSRRDYLHKLTTGLIRQYGALAIEDLNVSGMLRNRRLSKAIADVGLHELRRQLTYKSEWYGRELFVADRFAPTSKTCSVCGLIQESMPLAVREWECECGAQHDRDTNAATTILNFATAGRAGIARGAGHKPSAAADKVAACGSL